MKAVAVALVLIAGAAVVLWFGNTLNSWVLGGLIGGLAALLLSIPISLTLFSYLSRRQEEKERIRAEIYEEDEFFEDDGYDPPRLHARVARRTYEIESYSVPASPTLHEAEDFQRVRPSRQLPAPTAQRLPAPKTPRTTATSLQRTASQEMIARRGDPPTRSPEDHTQTNQTTRRLNYPGFPGYELGSAQSRQRSAALRAARIEAFQQFDGEGEEDDGLDFSPTQPPRRLASPRTSQALPTSHERSLESSRQLSQQMASQRSVRPNRNVVDSRPSQGGNERALPAAGESSASTRRPSSQLRKRRTDFLEQAEEQERTTEQSVQYSLPESGKLASELPEENLNRPLVRRAPYMYKDDPLRKELTRRLERPTTRRSSLHDPDNGDEEEDEF